MPAYGYESIKLGFLYENESAIFEYVEFELKKNDLSSSKIEYSPEQCFIRWESLLYTSQVSKKNKSTLTGFI